MNRVRKSNYKRTKVRRPTKRRPIPKKGVKRKLNKKKVAMTIVVFALLIIFIVKITTKDESIETSTRDNNTETNTTTVANNQPPQEEPPPTKKEITEWNLQLANYENILPEDFTVEVEELADDKYFDARAIKYLKQMINDMMKDGIKDIWVQSAYRSVERQKELYDNSINKYLKQGKTQEEAERLTDEYINKPGSSDHNLGLAVDFNFVNNEFEETKAFKWLKEHGEDYGFILRYPSDKEDITKIAYESWHWRYVGKDHAKKMNELNMCLEEYIEYLQNEGTE